MGIKKAEIAVKIHSLPVHHRAVLRVGILKSILGKDPFIGLVIVKLRGLQHFTIVRFEDHIPPEVDEVGIGINNPIICLYNTLVILLIK